MFEFERPNIEVEEISEDKKYGRFVVEPLERGYGITLGNSLRRIMLSSFTPGIELNSCNTPSILTWLTAAPGKEESIILLKELPNVIP